MAREVSRATGDTSLEDQEGIEEFLTPEDDIEEEIEQEVEEGEQPIQLEHKERGNRGSRNPNLHNLSISIERSRTDNGSASNTQTSSRSSRGGSKLINANKGSSRSSRARSRDGRSPSILPIPSSSRNHLSIPSASTSEAGPSSRPSIATSHSARSSQPPRTSGIPVVELSLLPLSTLHRYATPLGSPHPTMRSRQDIMNNPTVVDHDDDEEEEEEEEDFEILPAGRRSNKIWSRDKDSETPKRNTRKREAEVISVISSEDFGGYGTENDESGENEEDMFNDEDEEEEEEGEEGYGRRRNLRSKGKGRQESSTPKRRTRANRRDDTSRSLRQASPMQNYRDSSEPMEESEIDSPPKQRRGRSRGKEAGKRARNSSGSEYNDQEEDELESEDTENQEEPVPDTLDQHRTFCERCSRGPADDLLEKALLKKKKGTGKKRKKKDEDDDRMSDEEVARTLGGWLECLTCTVACHWDCIGESQRKELLVALRESDGPVPEGQRLRKGLEIDEATTFTCAKCRANPACFVCHKEKILDEVKPDDKRLGEAQEKEKAKVIDGDDVIMKDVEKPVEDDAVMKDNTDSEGILGDEKKDGKEEEDEEEDSQPLKFRCLRCKQSAHYEHLKDPYQDGEEHDVIEIADIYQCSTEFGQAWYCHQCREWVWAVDMILAWRPFPADSKERRRAPNEIPHYKEPLPREYLVKWAARGFRHVTWVPHAWLLAMAPQRLRNFLEKGPALELVTDETLAALGDDIVEPTIAKVLESDDTIHGKKGHVHHSLDDKEEVWNQGGPPPEKDAEDSIPDAWRTVDRVLDVMLLPPKEPPKKKPKKTMTKRGKKSNRVMSESESELSEAREVPIIRDGLEPPKEEQMDIDDWEAAADRDLEEKDVDEVADLVTWCFVKWDDLQYDQSTWDTPPPRDSPLYPAFKLALKKFLVARRVIVPILTRAQVNERDDLSKRIAKPPEGQPDCIKGGTLMPFQINGFSWLVYNHFQRHSCILADDMGLGKTIQIASMLGYLGTKALYPALVVVPNSTITNWVREFEKWVPHMRVVPYYGESASRKIISKYELYRKGLQGKAQGLKAHVVLTTYDMITSPSEFSTFRNIPRWEVLCIDEGQRLKSDNSLIFNRLRSLNSVHRILMTGTPLNNNIRELFNLLNFLDPDNFNDLDELEKRFDQDKLDEMKVKELHEMVRPYILRRIKGDVLKLPPKIETIIPISLAPQQKDVYKLILERNKEILEAIIQNRKKRKVVPKPTLVVEAPIEAPIEAQIDAPIETPVEAPVGETAVQEEASTIKE